MSEEERPSTIREEVLKKIESGHATMRPKWHFVLGAFLLAAGIVSLLLALLALTSFMVFVVERSGAIYAPRFGFIGWIVLLRSLPWLLVLLAIFFVIILEVLLRRTAMTYRRPLVYSVIAVILVVALGVSIVARAHLHEALYHRARANTLPYAGRFYRQFGAPRTPLTISGIVRTLTDHGFILEDAQGQTVSVIVNMRTRRPPANELAVGERLVVFGRRTQSAFLAFAIRPADADDTQ